ncbi:MAG: hypothetical protein ABIR56_08955, partial [Polaromonas sp.]
MSKWCFQKFWLPYYEKPEIDTPLDADGYLHTGDYARLDEDGFLWLTGRKSEVFKTSTGRRIAPVPIESSLKAISIKSHPPQAGRMRMSHLGKSGLRSRRASTAFMAFLDSFT